MCINFRFSKYFFVIITAIGSLIILGCFSNVVIPEEDRRIQELNKVLMCPVCPGESLDQSQNELSAQMRAIVKEKIDEGWTDKQIKDYFEKEDVLIKFCVICILERLRSMNNLRNLIR